MNDFCVARHLRVACVCLVCEKLGFCSAIFLEFVLFAGFFWGVGDVLGCCFFFFFSFLQKPVGTE